MSSNNAFWRSLCTRPHRRACPAQRRWAVRPSHKKSVLLKVKLRLHSNPLSSPKTTATDTFQADFGASWGQLVAFCTGYRRAFRALRGVHFCRSRRIHGQSAVCGPGSAVEHVSIHCTRMRPGTRTIAKSFGCKCHKEFTQKFSRPNRNRRALEHLRVDPKPALLQKQLRGFALAASHLDQHAAGNRVCRRRGRWSPISMSSVPRVIASNSQQPFWPLLQAPSQVLPQKLKLQLPRTFVGTYLLRPAKRCSPPHSRRSRSSAPPAYQSRAENLRRQVFASA